MATGHNGLDYQKPVAHHSGQDHVAAPALMECLGQVNAEEEPLTHKLSIRPHVPLPGHQGHQNHMVAIHAVMASGHNGLHHQKHVVKEPKGDPESATALMESQDQMIAQEARLRHKLSI